MAYLVLARKYRPQTFDQVIGQEHIADILKKAIESNRIAHAYLFSGPRGIGKTSCARILAKSLNCEKGPTLKPCGKCSACQEIANGTSFDVLEIDGASNRGIDEIRTLRENIKFAPSYGRYKIYIVDEVHMLTMEAFNALLKTLEEPPAHAKFIFATTAPQKVPATILSRCQRFDFKRIALKAMVEALASISKEEKIEIDQKALYAIAKAAQGGMRDALSILDQLSALSGQSILVGDVFTMLGMVETQFLFELTDALGQKNCILALEALEKIVDKGKDVKQLLKDITEHFRNLLIIKIGGKALGKLVEYPVEIKDMLLTQCEQFTVKEILNAIDVFIETQEISRITESIQMPLEIAIAKLTYKPELPPLRENAPNVKPSVPLERESLSLKKTTQVSAVSNLKNQTGEIDLSNPKINLQQNVHSESTSIAVKEQDSTQEHEDIETAGSLEVIDLEKIEHSWDALTHAVSREKMSIATYLQEGAPIGFKNSKLTIGFHPKSSFHKENLEAPATIKMVEKIFSEKLKSPIRIEYKIIEDHAPQEEESIVKTVLDTFKGKVINRWHNE